MEHALTPSSRTLKSIPGRLADSCVLWQCRTTGIVSIHGHHVFAPGLGASSVVIDAGANIGAFARQMVERFGCRCYALEPVPELLEQIAEEPRLRRVPLALGGATGEVVLHLSGNPEAHSVQARIAEHFGSRGTLVARLSTLEDFFVEERLDGADLLKLDIEGAEIAVLEAVSDATLARIGQITVEFHDHLGGCPDGSAIKALQRRLRRAGFLCLVMSRPSGHHGDTLFINRRRSRLSPGTRLNLFLMSEITLRLRFLMRRIGTWIG
jgi:FkbM family methyltransferase